MGDNMDSNNIYLRYEKVLGNVWEEGLLGPLGTSFQLQQDNTMVMLTTSALVLIVAIMDSLIYNRNSSTDERI